MSPESHGGSRNTQKGIIRVDDENSVGPRDAGRTRGQSSKHCRCTHALAMVRPPRLQAHTPGPRSETAESHTASDSLPDPKHPLAITVRVKSRKDRSSSHACTLIRSWTSSGCTPGVTKPLNMTTYSANEAGVHLAEPSWGDYADPAFIEANLDLSIGHDCSPNDVT